MNRLHATIRTQPKRNADKLHEQSIQMMSEQIPEALTVPQVFCWLVTRDLPQTKAIEMSPAPITVRGQAPEQSPGTKFFLAIIFNDVTTRKGAYHLRPAIVGRDGQWSATIMSDDAWKIQLGTAKVRLTKDREKDDELPGATFDGIELSQIESNLVARPPERWQRYDGSSAPIDFFVEMAPIVSMCLEGEITPVGVRMYPETFLKDEDSGPRIRMGRQLEAIPKEIWTHCRFHQSGKVYLPDNPTLDKQLMQLLEGWPVHHRYTVSPIHIDREATDAALATLMDYSKSHPIWANVRIPFRAIIERFPPSPPPLTQGSATNAPKASDLSLQAFLSQLRAQQGRDLGQKRAWQEVKAANRRETRKEVIEKLIEMQGSREAGRPRAKNT